MQNKCEGCGGDLVWSPASNYLECTQCGGRTGVKRIVCPSMHNYQAGTDVPSIKPIQHSYTCTTCGGVFSSSEGALTRCPGCGAKTLVPSTNNFNYLIDGIVPFKVSKKDAMEKLTKWIKGKKMAPNDLKHLFKLGKATGYYIPQYEVDLQTIARYKGSGEHRETITKVDRDGRRSTYVVAHPYSFSGTKKKNTYRLVNASGRAIPALGAYNTNELCGYLPQYTYGFSSAQRVVDLTNAFNITHRTIISEIENQIRFEEDNVSFLRVDPEFFNEKYRLNLFPVWVTHYTYKNKQYSCYVNGQTGTVSGSTPISGWKVLFIVLAAVAAIAGIATAIIHATTL